jgi:hypothetical protein
MQPRKQVRVCCGCRLGLIVADWHSEGTVKGARTKPRLPEWQLIERANSAAKRANEANLVTRRPGKRANEANLVA